MKTLKLILVSMAAAALLIAALSIAGGTFAFIFWRSSHPAPLKDLSEGTLEKTFSTRSPSLQAKLKDLDKRKLLPNQYPPKDFDDASKRLWESFAEMLNSEPFEKLLAGLDAFSEFRAGEPRYSQWPDAATTPEQLESLLRFIKFNLQEQKALDAFKDDAPFKRAGEFIDSAVKVATPCRRPTDIEAEPPDLMEMLKVKLYMSLAEGRRAAALHMLDSMFKLSRSPLAPGLDGEALRDEAAACAVAALKTKGWDARELKAMSRIVEREAAAPFMHERILTAERLATLFAFECSRECGKGAEAMDILRDTQCYYEDYGCGFAFSQALDLADALTRDIDQEELLELDLIDALERKGALPESAREAFVKGLGRDTPLSPCEERLVRGYSFSRSHSAATLFALSAALRASLELPPRKNVENPLTGESSIKCQRVDDGFEADIAPANSEKAFAPFIPPQVENPSRKM